MRKASLKVEQRNTLILDQIRAFKAEHPFWGYRRIWAYLKFIDTIDVNKKWVLRLMKEHQLIVSPETSLRAKRRVEKSQAKAQKPNEIYWIDMTKIKFKEQGWGYRVVVIDGYTRKIIGSKLDTRSKSNQWLLALNRAACLQCREGKGIKLVSDNGCQLTSIAFMEATSLFLPGTTTLKETSRQKGYLGL